MGKITSVIVGIEDRVTVAKFQSIGPTVTLVADVDPGEDANAVTVEKSALVHEMWEKELCLRLWWRIDMAQKFGGPMPDPWAMQMYEYLHKKHYAGTDDGPK